MPVGYSRWERRDGVSRTDFALAALQWCRTARAQEKTNNARYYWQNASTIVILQAGEQGMFDFQPEPDEEAVKAGYALDDVAHMVEQQQWADAAPAAAVFRDIGSPTGEAYQGQYVEFKTRGPDGPLVLARWTRSRSVATAAN